MDQRRPRLGDIVDDYCTRERRLTNHAVVAMVGEDIKQTRCTTCDAEHAYKGGRVPAKRKRPEPAGKIAEPPKAPQLVADEAAEPEASPEAPVLAAPPAAPAPSPAEVSQQPEEGTKPLAADAREDD